MSRLSKTTGRIKWFSDARGYGFVTPDDGGADVFFHRTDIVEELRTARPSWLPKTNDRVSYALADSRLGNGKKAVCVEPAHG